MYPPLHPKVHAFLRRRLERGLREHPGQGTLVDVPGQGALAELLRGEAAAAAGGTRIIYGGSVTAQNCDTLAKQVRDVNRRPPALNPSLPP
eukprot:1188065-Prorocentrum_minimum.AAC.5